MRCCRANNISTLETRRVLCCPHVNIFNYPYSDVYQGSSCPAPPPYLLPSLFCLQLSRGALSRVRLISGTDSGRDGYTYNHYVVYPTAITPLFLQVVCGHYKTYYKTFYLDNVILAPEASLLCTYVATVLVQ
jgi:hypothetical protein